MQLDSRPFFEHYPIDATYDPKTGAFDCEICIPVSPLPTER
jgi:AraC family transcriptional regulator